MTQVDATAEIGARRPVGHEPDVRVVVARGRVLLLVGVGDLEIVGKPERARAQRQRIADAPPCASIEVEEARRPTLGTDGVEDEVEIAAAARDEPVAATVRETAAADGARVEE